MDENMNINRPPSQPSQPAATNSLNTDGQQPSQPVEPQKTPEQQPISNVPNSDSQLEKPQEPIKENSFLNKDEQEMGEDTEEVADEDIEEDLEDQVEDTTDRVDVLINLLIKKNLITEEELQTEYDAWIAEKETEESE